MRDFRRSFLPLNEDECRCAGLSSRYMLRGALSASPAAIRAGIAGRDMLLEEEATVLVF